MRPDFNKLLTERERHGHFKKFGLARHDKRFSPDEEMLAGRESMKFRHDFHWGRKDFNENLNPLRNFIRCSVGRKWDDVYSEICQNFDKRKVINAHILQHLFQYVELEITIIDGKPHEFSRYNGGYTPLNYTEWYVDPRDGILKENTNRVSKAQKKRDDNADLKKRQDKVYRKLDDDTHLFKCKDGIWYVYTAQDRPEPTKILRAPEGLDWLALVEWKSLPREEREKTGHWEKQTVHVVEFSTPEVPGMGAWGNRAWQTNRLIIPQHRYFARRQTASKALLKAHGLENTGPDEETLHLSHRERSKYRKGKAA